MDDYRDVEDETHRRLVRALRQIAKGRIASDKFDYAVTVGRMQSIAEDALLAGPYPVGLKPQSWEA